MWAQQEQCSPARIVSGAGSLKSPSKFEEPGQGWGEFFSKAASKGLPRPLNAAGWRCPNMFSCTQFLNIALLSICRPWEYNHGMSGP
jgi:hypothetical protein